jgi:hypothetical protein
LKIPKEASIVRCNGLAIVSGLWNSRGHFFKPDCQNAASAPADRLSKQLQAMLLRYGFVHVVDPCSFLNNTLAPPAAKFEFRLTETNELHMANPSPGKSILLSMAAARAKSGSSDSHS